VSAVLSLNPSYYEALKRLTLELAGVNLGTDHAFLIETRLSGLARTEGFDSLDDMVEELFKSGQSRLAVQVVSSLLERDTHFYTDRSSFDKLENVILPLLHPIHKGGTVRILSFGCSSGQEPYCLAMTLDKIKEKLILKSSAAYRSETLFSFLIRIMKTGLSNNISATLSPLKKRIFYQRLIN